MRASKISRETTKLINALSTTRKTRSSEMTSSSQRNYNERAGAQINEEESDVGTNSGSELSSTPSESSDEEFSKALSRKRKRAATVVKSEYFTNPATTSTTSKKPRRQPAKKITTASGQIKIEPPSGWEELYSLTKQMRQTLPAPVDTMGCERLADTAASPRDQRFQTLISLMLSSQTKDTVTAAAISSLMTGLEGGLTLESILAVEPEKLNGLIGKVGFHNMKTKHIKSTAILLRDNFSSDIPSTIDGLTSLPGVGPKMAYLCMSAAWGRDEGIGVDVHVHRITNMWSWHKTKTPEETRKQLEAWLPRDKWHEINWLLVGLGQTLCTPEVGRRRCGECVLGVEGICPARKAGVGRVKREAKVQVKMEETLQNEDEVVKEEVIVKEEEEVVGEIGVNSAVDIEDIGSLPRRSRQKKPR